MNEGKKTKEYGFVLEMMKDKTGMRQRVKGI